MPAHLPRAGVVRALAAAVLTLVTATLAAPAATQTPPPTKYVVFAHPSVSWVETGGTVRVVGHVRPRAPGAKVWLLQRLQDSRRWTRTDSDRLDRKGHFELVDRPSRVGVRAYRVFMPPGDGLRGDRSYAMKVAVMQWERLTDLEPWAGCGMNPGSTVQVGGTTYPDSLVFTGYTLSCLPFIQYDLGGRCQTLRTTYGFVDGTAHPGAVGSASVSAGSVSLETYRIVPDGRTFVDEEISIPGVQRLGMTLVSANNDPTAPLSHVAAGTPEVLCLP